MQPNIRAAPPKAYPWSPHSAITVSLANGDSSRAVSTRPMLESVYDKLAQYARRSSFAFQSGNVLSYKHGATIDSSDQTTVKQCAICMRILRDDQHAFSYNRALL